MVLEREMDEVEKLIILRVNIVSSGFNYQCCFQRQAKPQGDRER